MEYVYNVKDVMGVNGNILYANAKCCVACATYAEHFSYTEREIKCKYCNFKYNASGHLVFLEAYGKIMFKEFRNTKGTLLKHALSEHPEHFHKKK